MTTITPVTTRPRSHFAPAKNWMNDPNGLVFHKGRYHLYFQYNPDGIEHANMSWGHASSIDLIRWIEHPVAIPADGEGGIFSGSIVFDVENSSGFGSIEAPPLVAVYTHDLAASEKQVQSLAYSLDDGMTWTKFFRNPVLDRNSANFRDPKVFRYHADSESYWVMVAVEARERQVVLYRSDDLVAWSFLSSYGPAGAVDGIWECPDLFPLAVDGDPDKTKWVLLISMNPGGVAGGSGTQYVVGHFDGLSFTPEDTTPDATTVTPDAQHAGNREPQTRAELEQFDWLDFGRDCYAGVTFSGLAESERILIAWMSNWDYAHAVPTSPWRGTMTLPRRLELVSTQGRPQLRQTPIAHVGVGTLECDGLRIDDAHPFETSVAASGTIELRAVIGIEAILMIRLRHDADRRGGIVITYDPRSGRLASDRRGAAKGMPDDFATVQHLTVAPSDTITLTVHIDTSSIEIFAQGGRFVLTDLVFTGADDPGLTISSVGGETLIEHLRVTDDSL